MAKLPNLPSLSSKTDPNIRRGFDALKAFFGALQGEGGVISGTSLTRAILASEGATNLKFPDLSVPPQPSGLAAGGGFNSIFLSWDPPGYNHHAYTQLYRSTVDDFGTAVAIGAWPGAVASDVPPDSRLAVTYYYWIRFVSIGNVEGPLNATAGTPGSTADEPAYLLEILEGEVTASKLNNALSTRIDLIDTPTTGLVAVTEALSSDLDTLTSTVNDLTVVDYDAAVAYSVDDRVRYQGNLYKCIQGTTAGTAPTDTDYWLLIGAYTSLSDQVAQNASAITTESQVRATADSTEATERSRLYSESDALIGEALLEQILADEAAGVDRRSTRAVIDRESATRTSVMEAETSARELLTARVDGNEAALEEEKTTRANAISAEASARQLLTAKTVTDHNTAMTSILSEQTARTTADSAEASIRTTLLAELTGTSGGYCVGAFGEDQSACEANEGVWVPGDSASNGKIAAALATAQGAQETADREIVGFFQDAAPAEGMTFGDIWIDTNGANPLDTTCIYRYQNESGGSSGTLGWRVASTNAIGLLYLDVAIAQAAADDAQTTADAKRRTFTSTPMPPYDVGDLWSGGSTGDLKRCKTAKTSQQSYASGDWELASKYTDDTLANQKMRIFYGDGAVLTTAETGDLWIKDDGAIHKYNGTTWDAQKTATESRAQAMVYESNIAIVGYCEANAAPGVPVYACYTDGVKGAEASAAACALAGGEWGPIRKPSDMPNVEDYTWVAGTPLAESVKQLQISDGNQSLALEQLFQAHRTATGSLEGQYSVKIDNNGFLTGFGLSSEVVDGTPFGSFQILADRFALIDPSATVKAVSSMTRSASTATVTATAHGFATADYVVITGAAQPEYNGAHQVTNTGANTFTFPVADSPASPATAAEGMSLKAAGASLPFVVQEGKVVIDAASIVNLTAENFVGGAVHADTVEAGISVSSPVISGGSINGSSLDVGNGKAKINVDGSSEFKAITIKNSDGSVLLYSGGPGASVLGSHNKLTKDNATTYIADLAVDTLQIAEDSVITPYQGAGTNYNLTSGAWCNVLVTPAYNFYGQPCALLHIIKVRGYASSSGTVTGEWRLTSNGGANLHASGSDFQSFLTAGDTFTLFGADEKNTFVSHDGLVTYEIDVKLTGPVDFSHYYTTGSCNVLILGCRR